ncbi:MULTISPECIES: hypothetical protein [Carnobacterium]|uniref:hypothetical protein n=1 Tax=Carnobacterium TaxID=2747 RepID=UPI00288FC6E7|nr:MULTISPECIES: hypothetical protein [Carnobacterium]MDT1940251.1 hypothetical protein [Carnobacterium divergens]MDT1942689.1 hypothetical protein [Carnobacterium divergens]MDT1948495.1 hypothetical protein [Carnobacterium divergens]MDT1950976.1 hypothetical protein [Carnobacterium divergens]MDT1955806.1 hypothetical protein [Carnobacterium divergens]
MKNQLTDIYECISKINKRFDDTIINESLLVEEQENLLGIDELQLRLASNLSEISDADTEEILLSKLIQLHLTLTDIEWQYEQIHDLFGTAMPNLAEKIKRKK